MFERFFWDNNGTLEDKTIEWTNPNSKTAPYDGQGYIYISSYLPFNHRYFDIDIVNDQGGTLKIDHWWSSEWKTVVDNLDYSELMTKSGNILFTIDKDNGWDAECESSDIPELANTNVYDAYWMRVSLQTPAPSALTINYIGYKFAEESDLFFKYPMLNNARLKSAFASGKTDWNDQLFDASQYIVKDLKSRKIVISKNQVLTLDRYRDACVHKAAEIIFNGLDEKWVNYIDMARDSYSKDMNLEDYGVDQTGNGQMDRIEKASISNGRMSR